MHHATLCVRCVCKLSRYKPLLLLYISDVMADLFLWSVLKKEICLPMHLFKKHLLSTYYIQGTFRYMADTEVPCTQEVGSVQMN